MILYFLCGFIRYDERHIGTASSDRTGRLTLRHEKGRVRAVHFICAYFIVTEYATFEHSGAGQLSQSISPFDTVFRVLTIALIILVKSNPLSTHSEHKQFTLNKAELPGKKLTVRDNGSNAPV